MTITPAIFDLTIHKGATFRQVFTWQSGGALVNLTGYAGEMMVRVPRVESATALIDLSTTNGKMALGDTAGTITVMMIPTETAALKATSQGVYDILLTAPGGEKHFPVKGSLTIEGHVIR